MKLNVFKFTFILLTPRFKKKHGHNIDAIIKGKKVGPKLNGRPFHISRMRLKT